MIFKIDLDDPEAIYRQIAAQVILAMAEGCLPAGQSLPSVRRLAADLSINLHTVNKAYQLLQDEGFITIRRSRGAMVNPPESYAADDKYKEGLRADLKSLCTKARLKGLGQKEIEDLIKNIFSSF